MKTRILIPLLLLLQIAAFASPPEDGKTIFMSRCAACHNVNKQIVGPALAGVELRHPIEWIIKFVNSSQTVIKSGDSAALALFQRFNKVPMPDHADLTADDIKNIVEYIKGEAKPLTEDKAPFAKPGKKMDLYQPLSLQKDYSIFLGFFIVLIMLIASLLFAVRLNEFKRKAAEKDSA